MEKEYDDYFVRQARPTIIKPLKASHPVRNGEVTICMGDAHIGYREKETFHSERALKLGILAVRLVQPDNVILLGDMLDLAPFSRFSQRTDWQQSTQKTIDRYHQFLAEIRANVPKAKIVSLEGNHSLRIPNFIQKNAAELLNIKRANIAHELGVLTVAYLCRFEELKVESVSGYPNATYWLEDDLKCCHGTNVAKGGSNAAKYLNNEMTSTIFGHTHRLELAYKTIPTRLGNKQIAAASPGCLARIDGAVPGHKYSVSEDNTLVKQAENWQQGILCITHDKKEHNITPCRITEQGINIYGKTYK